MFEKLTKSNITIGFLIIIALILGINPFLGVHKMAEAETGFNKLVQEVMKSKIEALEEAIKLNTDFRIDEYIKLILKNAKKIESDPDDIKRTDIVLCISYFGLIPDERKTEEVQAAIAVIIEWDQNHP